MVQIVDASGQAYRLLEQWFPSGALRESQDLGAVQFRFPVHAASGALQFEFGDIRAFTV